MEYLRESFAEAAEELAPLFFLHWEERREPQDPPLDMAWPVYFQMEEQGILRLVTARYDGVIVGYFVMNVMPHPSRQAEISAYEEGWYIHPAFRGQGARLLKEAEQYAGELGAAKLYVNMPLRAEKLMNRKGYKMDEVTYVKEITHG